MTINVVDLTGKKVSTTTLPKDIFEVKVNQDLLSQAMRVYKSNQHQGSSVVLTRGQVKRTTAKVYKQKGTGNARHGSRRAPIYVGGGITHGPKSETPAKLKLNKKMRKQALFNALSLQVSNSIVVDGLDKVGPLTKDAKSTLATLAKYEHKSKDNILLVLPKSEKSLLLACRNLPGVTVTQVSRINIFEILKAKKILFAKDSIKAIVDVYKKEKTQK